MAKLKLGPIESDKPVRMTIELPAPVHRDLLVYTKALIEEAGHELQPEKLIAPMLQRFMATDRGFAKFRHATDRDKTSNASDKMA